MNRNRLEDAMALPFMGLTFFKGKNEWPMKRCAICGRLASPLDEEGFIAQCDQGNELFYYICQNHGGPNGSTYTNCLTAQRIEVGASPALEALIWDNLKHELKYWLCTALRYMRFTAHWYLQLVLHPIAAYRYYASWNIDH